MYLGAPECHALSESESQNNDETRDKPLER